MSQTANEAYYNLSVVASVEANRFIKGLIKDLLKIRGKEDERFIKKLRAILSNKENREQLLNLTGSPRALRNRNFIRIVNDILNARNVIDISSTLKELEEFADLEIENEEAIIKKSIPIVVDLKKPSKAAVESVKNSIVIEGASLDSWLFSVQDRDKERIKREVSLGVLNGYPNEQIIRNIKARGVETTNKNLESIVRTSANQIKNQAREAVRNANGGLFDADVWVSTLDGRTSAICRGRDGRASPREGKQIPKYLKPLTPPDARPPAHFRCRSTMVGVISGVGLIGERPYVTSKQSLKEINFKEMAERAGTTVHAARQRWIDLNVGRVPAATNYNDFLKNQKEEFQISVLGKEKARLFRSGKLTLDKFTDEYGGEYTLSQLRQKYPSAFE